MGREWPCRPPATRPPPCAQDVATTLAAYFSGHQGSFWMLRDASDHQQHQQQPLQHEEEGGGSGGEAPPPGTASAAGRLPLVPRLRRAHWERCMAAMCLASGLTGGCVGGVGWGGVGWGGVGGWVGV